MGVFDQLWADIKSSPAADQYRAIRDYPGTPLAYALSQVDSVKRRLSDAVRNPVDYLSMLGGQINDDPDAFGAKLAGAIAPGHIGGRVPFKYPRQAALDLAQQHAALPVEQGGLGLHPANTPMERAAAMGINADGFHGSLYDIPRFDTRKASTESHAGIGTYITDSPVDASRNYASLYGPDVAGKLERGIEAHEDPDSTRRIAPGWSRRLQDGTLTGNQQRLLAERYLGADNLGVVYPLLFDPGKVAHLDNPKLDTFIPRSDHYDESTGEYTRAEHAPLWERAYDNVESAGDGSAASDIINALSDDGHTIDGAPAAEIYRTAKRSTDGTYNDDGEYVGPSALAGEFVRGLGIDTIQHTPRFANPQLNLGNTHSIVFDPSRIRSPFAAFDPFLRDSPDLLAGGLLPGVVKPGALTQSIQGDDQ